jgi:hypothetical protein
MKKYWKVTMLIVICLMTINYAKTQDVILTKDAKSIKAKILEINEFDVKYKDFDNLEGPNYTLKKTEIQTIVYQNGKVENFTPIDEPKIVEPTFSLKSHNEFMMMSDIEKDYYLLNIGNQEISEKFHRGFNLDKTGHGLFKAGLGLSIPGTVAIITGVILDIVIEELGFWFYITGGTMLGAGQVMLITSIPLRVVGGRLKNSAENMYQDYYWEKMNTSYLPTLNFGLTQNGIGLTIKF